MDDLKKKVGKAIKEARKAKGFTQKELGQQLGVADSVITNYESGKQNLTIDTLQKLAEALSVEVSTLFR
jgi:HTH-type transcriptional regulator/antitoxin HipB